MIVKLTRTRCSGVERRDIITAAVAAIRDASRKKCQGRNPSDAAGSRGSLVSLGSLGSLVRREPPEPEEPRNPGTDLVSLIKVAELIVKSRAELRILVG